MHRRKTDIVTVTGLAALAIGAAAVTRLMNETRNRPPDSAPGRTARQSRFGAYIVAGRTVTIDAPRDRIHAMWREPEQLARFMQDLRAVERGPGDRMTWVIATPGGDARIETRLVEDRHGEALAWRSVEGSDFDIEAKVQLRDAPAGRGTEVEAHVAWRPHWGMAGQWAAKLRRADPRTRGRHELKRLKMLLETGEIATNANQRNT
ncbi:SRPBCC family protein [Paracoccus rhizosphaerae]|uniref:SRPBCC family protein n=1 Tax=Paracoccus rhizosphaerae TaxID=1133347 RepID=A0ABV6CEK5_9RHOB|nr:SRPBCC family protein [Paracoccus rhizosphaerae]